MQQTNSHPFEALSPDQILTATEQQGFTTDGRITALNSYENRVYQIGIDGASPLVAKFYRPNRWNREQIQEEHDFLFDLQAHDIPVVVPIKNETGESLFEQQNFLFALFPRTGGYAPELDHEDNLAIMGRTLARLHLIGEQQLFQSRPALDAQTFGQDSIDFVANQFIPFEQKSAYLSISNDIMAVVKEQLAGASPIRVHGDLHVGNILMREDIPNLVDFDDARNAPAIQDIWMLLSGTTDEQRRQIAQISEAYNAFRTFPIQQLKMIEALRTLRLIHHTAWLARRWDDPAFPPAFGWFDTPAFWTQHLADLSAQLDALQQPAMTI